jgi:hypothetical protein
VREISGGEFGDLIQRFRATAFRLEQQPAYAVPNEAEQFDQFRAGLEPDPKEMPGFAAWLDDVATFTRQGRRMSRVRVQSDPPTDYQRWARFVGRWNIDAGEDIRYATRAKAEEVGLLPSAGPHDWWLLDDAQLLRMTFDNDNRCVERHLITDEPSLERARAWRELAIRAASD